MATVERRKHTSFAPAPAARLEASTVRDVLLVALTFASGAVDAIAFLGLDKVFSTFMTGNLVFLGLGIAGAPDPDPLRVLSALGGFAAGVVVAVRIVKPTKGSGIWPSRVTVALAAATPAQIAFLAGWILTSGRPSATEGDVLIGLSALAFGMHSGAVMSLDVKGVFTTAATATLIMLASEEAGWKPSEWRLHSSVILGLVAGAAAGAFLLIHARSAAPVVPLAVTLAVIATATVALKPQR
jgi:uncharacterized membrane protein YoaK (UPF0700 family)